MNKIFLFGALFLLSACGPAYTTTSSTVTKVGTVSYGGETFPINATTTESIRVKPGLYASDDSRSTERIRTRYAVLIRGEYFICGSLEECPEVVKKELQKPRRTPPVVPMDTPGGGY